jgi:hypothetical protein
MMEMRLMWIGFLISDFLRLLDLSRLVELEYSTNQKSEKCGKLGFLGGIGIWGVNSGFARFKEV